MSKLMKIFLLCLFANLILAAELVTNRTSFPVPTSKPLLDGDSVEFYETSDDGKTWKMISNDKVVVTKKTPSYMFETKLDGKYGFWVRYIPKKGKSNPIPKNGEKPPFSVIIDTVLPRLKNSSVEIIKREDKYYALISWSGFDAHPTNKSVSIDMSLDSKAWVNKEKNLPIKGKKEIELFLKQGYIKLTIKDAASNKLECTPLFFDVSDAITEEIVEKPVVIETEKKAEEIVETKPKQVEEVTESEKLEKEKLPEVKLVEPEPDTLEKLKKRHQISSTQTYVPKSETITVKDSAITIILPKKTEEEVVKKVVVKTPPRLPSEKPVFLKKEADELLALAKEYIDNEEFVLKTCKLLHGSLHDTEVRTIEARIYYKQDKFEEVINLAAEASLGRASQEFDIIYARSLIQKNKLVRAMILMKRITSDSSFYRESRFVLYKICDLAGDVIGAKNILEELSKQDDKYGKKAKNILKGKK